MAAAIADVERELDTGAGQSRRLGRKCRSTAKRGGLPNSATALSAQARRIREMDVLLAGVAAADDATHVADELGQ